VRAQLIGQFIGLLICLAWLVPKVATAGPFFDGLQAGLLSCQAALRGALRQNDMAAANERMSLCEPHMESLLGNSFPTTISLSTTQKKKLLLLTERHLRLIRELTEKIRKMESHAPDQVTSIPFKARLTSFEGGLRVFHERLSSLETWALNTGLRFGVERYLDGSLGGASAIVLLDHGSKVDAAFEVATSTPLREEGGVIELPPREADALAVTQAWLEFKRFRNFQLKVGVFPDQEGYFTPKRWPFVSVLGRASLYHMNGVELAATLRHDTFGVFSPQQMSRQARLFERNLSEMVGTFETARSDLE
jgi:hypothetical protein